jgi:fatty acid CoA ligase FadD36
VRPGAVRWHSAGVLTSLLDPDLPDGPAVSVGGDTLARAQLLDAAAGVAAALRSLPPGPVAVHALADVSTAVAVVGGLLAGVPVVPVPPDSGPVEREHVLRDSGATVWAGPADLAGGLASLVPGAATYGGERPDLDATALVLYTSGTTGLPKGVPHSGRSLAACLDGLAAAWEWTSDDVLVHGLPLFHLHGLVLGLLGPLRVGSPLVHTVRPDPASYAAARGSVYFGVPTVWHRVVGSPDAARELRGARLLVSGSAPLPVSTFTALRDLTGLAPLERYGMTETGITLSAVTTQPPRAGWVGLPVGDTETRVVGVEGDGDGDGIGRLEVRGSSVMRGYLGRATPELSDDGWFATGDVAEVDADGWHRIVGRESTDLIKSGGYRVGAGEVETVLLDHPAVDECAVVGVPDDDLGQRIVAYVVGADAGGSVAEELVTLVAERLSWHKRPREVRFVDALPRNAMGKVQKTVLAEG